MKNEFLAALAHDLRNGLAPIRNAIHVLRLSTPPSEAAQENWDIMDRQVTHLMGLVNRLLDAACVGEQSLQLPNEQPCLVPRRVLVVDDNIDSAATLGQLLRLLGHDVRVINDGAGTVSLAGDFRPDMIFLDIGLPGMDGYEVARRLRADPRFDSVVIAAVTGYGSPQDRQRSRDAGFNVHFVKPVDLERLKQLLAFPQALLPGKRVKSATDN